MQVLDITNDQRTHLSLLDSFCVEIEDGHTSAVEDRERECEMTSPKGRKEKPYSINKSENKRGRVS